MDKLEQLTVKLNELGLVLGYGGGGLYSVKNPKFANPLLFFSETNKGNKYDGNTTVKSINVQLYTSDQVYKALKLVDEYLLEQ